MRVPLRIQVFLPFAGLLAVTIVAISFGGAWQALRIADDGMRDHVRDAAGVLVAADLPLTDAVLQQTRQLAGAEFIGVDALGHVRASSLDHEADITPLAASTESGESVLAIDGVEYLHQVVNRSARPTRDGITRIHILYPQDLRRRLQWEAIGSPVAIGGTALVTAAAISWWLAARVCRPIARVREQFRTIAGGGSGVVPLPPRDDELRDLVGAVNALAQQLQDRDDAVRRAARSSLLGQLSGGLCHHLRNAAAGAKLALQLYRRRTKDDADELDVALRQLTVSEEYLQRLLTLGKPQAPRQREVDLRAVVEESVSLFVPVCRHRGVTFDVDLPPGEVRAAAIDADLLRSAIVNLLSNGLDAAGENGWIELRLTANETAAVISVLDGGPGLPPAVAAKLFEPFVTAKPDGVGLGLAASMRIAEIHGGTLSYFRETNTCFELSLPLSPEGAASAGSSDIQRVFGSPRPGTPGRGAGGEGNARAITITS